MARDNNTDFRSHNSVKLISIITKVANSRIPCFFISPHLDDAILSAGSLMKFLSKKTKIRVINVFTTSSPKPYTKFAQGFLESCGFTDAERLFLVRKKEDKDVFGNLGIKTKCLDFIDAAWRKRQVFFNGTRPIYPTRADVLSGKIAPADGQLFNKISNSLDKLIIDQKKSLIFCPLGVGNHIDHIITREVCRKNFSNLIYWRDFPYCINCHLDKELLKKNKLELLFWKRDDFVKRELILNYKSQIYSLFSDGYIPSHKEVYFLNPQVLKTLDSFS